MRTFPSDEVCQVLRQAAPFLNEAKKGEGKGIGAYGPAYEAWISDIKSQLEETANKVLNALLWRAGIQGGPLRLSTHESALRWSEDEDDSDSLGFLNHQVPAGIFLIGLPESQSLDIAFDQLPTPVGDSSYGCPPLAHELLREAWRNLRVHPNSALVIGVAAAETGLKTLIVELVPQNGWLIKELQSPPIEKLATKYLPTLPARCTLEGEVRPPPKSTMGAIRSGVKSRNDIVHGRGETPTSDQVRSLLLAVKDLLYLCDYYAGNQWALDLIRAGVRRELGLKT
jgi:hypothetical protein